MKDMTLIGFLARAALVAGYMWLENDYYGHHWKPQSEGELIADGLGILIFAVCFFA